MPLGLDPSEAAAGRGAAPRREPSLLLVDDDPFMLGMQSRMLRSMGYTMIGTATSAEAALHAAGRRAGVGGRRRLRLEHARCRRPGVPAPPG
ncbi:MAG: hypothetical protein MZW92_30285 [Comamonadaceae bacterium]|nr:hypothetical protein [Comamonadaceae bacterium]